MGNCKSCDSNQVATAKLVLLDGRLQEFSHPVKVSHLLQKYPMCFICDSDEMNFDDVVTAVDEDDELLSGQLYFALPSSLLKQPLGAQEMAALAVKASSALMKSSGGDKCGCRRKQIVFSAVDNSKPCRTVSSAVGGSVNRSMRTSAIGGSGGRGKLTAMLSSIPE